jgi:UDP-glucose 4-epimerase
MCRSMLKRCNVGTGHSVRLVDLVAALNAIIGTNLEPDFQPARAGDVRDSFAGLARISQVLGY